MKNNDREIHLRDILIKISDYKNMLLRKKYSILAISVIFSIIGFLFAFTSKSLYHAELTFSVESENSRGNSTLSGFSNQFGIDLGVSDVSSFSHNNIMEYILKSRNVIENTLMQEVTINNKKDLLIEHYLDVNKIKEDWSDGEGFSGVSFHKPNTYQHDSIMNGVFSNIVNNNLTIDLKSDEANIVSLVYTSVNEEFALKFVQVLINETKKLYIEDKTRQANNTLRFLQARKDSVNKELEKTDQELQKNKYNIRSSALLKQSSLETQKAFLKTVYLEIAKNLEASKISLLKSEPLIKIWDQPKRPLKKTARSKKIIVFLGFLLGATLSILYLVIRKFLRDAKNSPALPV